MKKLMIGLMAVLATVGAWADWTYHPANTGYGAWQWASDGNWTFYLTQYDDEFFSIGSGNGGYYKGGSGVIDLDALEKAFAPRKIILINNQLRGITGLTGVIWPESMTNSETSVSLPTAMFYDCSGLTEMDFSMFKSAIILNNSFRVPNLTKLVFPEAQTTIDTTTQGRELFPAVTEVYMPGRALTYISIKSLNTIDYQVRLFCDPVYDANWTKNGMVGGTYPISAITDADREDPHYSTYGLAEVEASGNLLGTIAPNYHGKIWLIAYRSPYRREGYLLDVTSLKPAFGGAVLSPASDGNFYEEGSEVTITAVPTPGNYFVQWFGDVPEGVDAESPTIKVTVDQTTSIQAMFRTNWVYHPANTGYNQYQWVSDGNWTFLLNSYDDTSFSLGPGGAYWKGGSGMIDLEALERDLAPRKLDLIERQFYGVTTMTRANFPRRIVKSESTVIFPYLLFHNCSGFTKLDLSKFRSDVYLNYSTMANVKKLVLPKAQTTIDTYTGRECFPSLTEVYLCGKAFSSIGFRSFNNAVDYQVRVYIDPTKDRNWNRNGLFGGSYPISEISSVDREDPHYAAYGLAEIEANGDLLGTITPNGNGKMWIIRWDSPAQGAHTQIMVK